MCSIYKGIVIFGEMGSGKDTFAEILLNNNSSFSMYNIGYICREFMRVSNVKDEWADKGRELAQLVAVKLREIDVNILNDYTYAKAMESSSTPIIVGGRTKDDFRYWKEKGFLTVGITIDYDVKLERLKSRDGSFDVNSFKHMTENDVKYISESMCEVVIDNSLDLDSLKLEIAKFIETHYSQIEKR